MQCIFQSWEGGLYKSHSFDVQYFYLASGKVWEKGEYLPVVCPLQKMDELPARCCMNFVSLPVLQEFKVEFSSLQILTSTIHFLGNGQKLNTNTLSPLHVSENEAAMKRIVSLLFEWQLSRGYVRSIEVTFSFPEDKAAAALLPLCYLWYLQTLLFASIFI